MRYVKTIKGYAPLARFMAGLKKVGYIPRSISSPYASSPTATVYAPAIIICETSHRRYQVWDVSGETIYRKERDAEAVDLERQRARYAVPA